MFKCTTDIRQTVTKELTSEVLHQMLADEHVKVQEQALMIYRNLFHASENEIQVVLDENGETLLN